MMIIISKAFYYIWIEGYYDYIKGCLLLMLQHEHLSIDSYHRARQNLSANVLIEQVTGLINFGFLFIKIGWRLIGHLIYNSLLRVLILLSIHILSQYMDQLHQTFMQPICRFFMTSNLIVVNDFLSSYFWFLAQGLLL